jgi:hypothetical protein
MRLACAEINQVDALGAQLGGLRGNSHGCGDLNPTDAVGKDLGRCLNCHNIIYFDRYWV